MEQGEIQFLSLVELGDRGKEGPFQRAILCPTGKQLEDPRIVQLGLALRSFLQRQLLPLHADIAQQIRKGIAQYSLCHRIPASLLPSALVEVVVFHSGLREYSTDTSCPFLPVTSWDTDT